MIIPRGLLRSISSEMASKYGSGAIGKPLVPKPRKPANRGTPMRPVPPRGTPMRPVPQKLTPPPKRRRPSLRTPAQYPPASPKK